MTAAVPLSREELNHLQHLLDTGGGTLERETVRRLLETAQAGLRDSERLLGYVSHKYVCAIESWHRTSSAIRQPVRPDCSCGLQVLLDAARSQEGST